MNRLSQPSMESALAARRGSEQCINRQSNLAPFTYGSLAEH